MYVIRGYSSILRLYVIYKRREVTCPSFESFKMHVTYVVRGKAAASSSMALSALLPLLRNPCTIYICGLFIIVIRIIILFVDISGIRVLDFICAHIMSSRTVEDNWGKKYRT